MKGLGDRILTTHVGSLVRPTALLEMIIDRVAGEAVDEQAFEALGASSVKDVVRKQAEVGVDIPSDGEFSKPDFHSYVVKRLGGIDIQPSTTGGFNYPKLAEEFPGFMRQYNDMFRTMWLPPEISREKTKAAMQAQVGVSVVTRPITYEGHAELQRDLDNAGGA